MMINIFYSGWRFGALSFYIWFPFVFSGFCYFFGMNREPAVVALVFLSIAALFIYNVIGGKLGPVQISAVDCIFGLLVLLMTQSLLLRGNIFSINSWFLFAYVLMPYLIGRTLACGESRRVVLVNFVLLFSALIFLSLFSAYKYGMVSRASVFGSASNSIPLSIVIAFFSSYLLSFKNYSVRFSVYLIGLSFAFGVLAGVLAPRWLLLAQLSIFVGVLWLQKGIKFEGKLIFSSLIGFVLPILLSQVKLNFYVSSGIVDGHASLVGSGEVGGSMMERHLMVKNGVELFLDNILYGVGVGNFDKFFGVAENHFPHMSLVQIFAELGIFGGGLWLSFVIFILYKLVLHVRADSKHLPYFSILLFGLIFSLFHGNYLTDKLIYIAAGYVASLQVIFHARAK